MNISLTPLFRHSVGFDHLDHLFNSLNKIDQSAPSYPPYNIEKLGDDEYRITLAVAGFSPEDVNIVAQGDLLTVTGKIAEAEEEKTTSYLHKGIATRSFERKFNLAEHVRVLGAELKDGLLKIELVREIPETAKPRQIEVKGIGSIPAKKKN